MQVHYSCEIGFSRIVKPIKAGCPQPMYRATRDLHPKEGSKRLWGLIMEKILILFYGIIISIILWELGEKRERFLYIATVL